MDGRGWRYAGVGGGDGVYKSLGTIECDFELYPELYFSIVMLQGWKVKQDMQGTLLLGQSEAWVAN